MNCVDIRNKPLIVGDLVALAPCGTSYSWSYCDYGKIVSITVKPPHIGTKGHLFELKFEKRKLTRYSYQVLKLEQ